MHLTRESGSGCCCTAAPCWPGPAGPGSPGGAPEAIALVCDEILRAGLDDVPYEQVVAAGAPCAARPAGRRGTARYRRCKSRRCSRTAPCWCTWMPRGAPRGRAAAGAPGEGEIELAPGRERATAVLHKHRRAPIWVSSHVPLDG